MSVSWGTQYAKLKTNLRLAANRLRLLQKKKTEQAMKARTEIADFLSSEKEDRARIRVESIIREDFVVEAYELLEMFCELLLARFGLIQQMKELDDGIAEAVSSLLWVAPRISHEVAEFKVINDQLQQKYGKPFAEAARMNQLPEPSRVSSKLVQKLSVSAPSKLLVEKYLIEIARCANIDFTPDPRVMRDDDDEIAVAERNLINFMNEDQIGWSLTGTRHPPAGGPGNYGPPPQDVGGNGQYPGGGGGNYGPPPPNVGGNGQHPGGGGGMQSYPQYPQMSQFTVPGVSTNLGGDAGPSPAAGPMLNMPNEEAPYLPPAALSSSSAQPSQNLSYQPSKQQSSQQYPAVNVPTSSYNSNVPMGDPNASVNHKTSEVPLSVLDDYLSQFPAPPKELPPRRGSGGGGHGGNVTSKPSASDNLDFDDLARRFKELKKRL